MANGEAKHSTPSSVASLLATHYGPYAFGVVSLLVIWFSIVKPELDSRQINFKAHNETLQMLGEQTRIQQDTARTMLSASQTLERIIERLDKTN